MVKKLLSGVLIFASISVLCGQDLHHQIQSLNDKYNIDIKKMTNNVIDSLFGFDFCEYVGDIWQEIEVIR